MERDWRGRQRKREERRECDGLGASLCASSCRRHQVETVVVLFALKAAIAKVAMFVPQLPVKSEAAVLPLFCPKTWSSRGNSLGSAFTAELLLKVAAARGEDSESHPGLVLFVKMPGSVPDPGVPQPRKPRGGLGTGMGYWDVRCGGARCKSARSTL